MATNETPGVVKTQGTQLWLRKPGNPADLQQFTCPSGINGLGGARDQIEVPCLGNTGDKQFVGGQGTPGQVSVPFSFIPAALSHRDLFTLKESGIELDWMILLSDGPGVPTLDADGEIEAPETRTTALFHGYIADVNLDIATNTIVSGTLTIQRSGGVTWGWAI